MKPFSKFVEMVISTQTEPFPHDKQNRCLRQNLLRYENGNVDTEQSDVDGSKDAATFTLCGSVHSRFPPYL
ncbi:MAG: hypothetical protein LBN30_05640 [Oscillospiraceae bacterium]|jgi:hypothetical protein|nr:hypothetical protein [Oscillospiraceae bacterium]